MDATRRTSGAPLLARARGQRRRPHRSGGHRLRRGDPREQTQAIRACREQHGLTRTTIVHDLDPPARTTARRWRGHSSSSPTGGGCARLARWPILGEPGEPRAAADVVRPGAPDPDRARHVDAGGAVVGLGRPRAPRAHRWRRDEQGRRCRRSPNAFTTAGVPTVRGGARWRPSSGRATTRLTRRRRTAGAGTPPATASRRSRGARERTGPALDEFAERPRRLAVLTTPRKTVRGAETMKTRGPTAGACPDCRAVSRRSKALDEFLVSTRRGRARRRGRRSGRAPLRRACRASATTSPSAFSGGAIVAPSEDSAYSTRGGTSACTRRTSRPSRSIARSVWVSTFSEIGARSSSSSW